MKKFYFKYVSNHIYGANYVTDRPATMMFTVNVNDDDIKLANQRGCTLYEVPSRMWSELYNDLSVNTMDADRGIKLPEEQALDLMAAIIKGDIHVCN
jgi:hypothetical protein